VCPHRFPIEAENCPNFLVGNRGVKATGLPKEVAASGPGITSLGASIEDLLGFKHCAKRFGLVHVRIMKMLTGILNAVFALKKLDNTTKRFDGDIFL
jgi:hypothetical protein